MKYVIGLSGSPNTGKTISLVNLIKDLLPQNASNIFWQWYQSQRSIKDLWFILPYKGGYVYIATCGDTPAVVSENIDFFNGNATKHTRRIHMYDAKSNSIVVADKNTYHSKCPPGIGISACRTAATTMDLLEQYANKVLPFKKAIFFRQFSKNSLSNNALKNFIQLL